MKVKFLGTGRSLPHQAVLSSDLDRVLNLTGCEVSNTGVRQRFVCVQESQIDLAVSAANIALRDAGLAAQDIDLVLSAAAVPFQPIPATAPLIMRELGIDDGTAAAFDMNSTCLSFVSALDLAARWIESGTARNALVVSSEVASRALPWRTQPDIAALFGDGAAAAVLGAAKGDDGRISAIKMRSYPSAYEACGIGAGGTRFDLETQQQDFMAHAKFSMDGKALFRVASRHFKEFVTSLLAEANWTRDQVDLVVPHQASPSGLDHMIRQTGFCPQKVMRIVEEFGNQIAASIPFALDLARKQGRVTPGSKVLLLGTSAGVSFGGAALVV